MLKDSAEYIVVRNRIYHELNQQQARDNKKARELVGGQTLTFGSVKAEFDSFFTMLVVSPHDPDSMETLAVLNYFNFPVDVQEDGMRGEWRQALSFKAEDPYPYLEIDSSTTEMPNAHLC